MSVSRGFIADKPVDASRGEELQEMAEKVGDCILCGGDPVALGEFRPEVQHRPLYAPEGIDPQKVGIIWYALCSSCVLEEDVGDKVEEQMKADAAKTKGEK